MGADGPLVLESVLIYFVVAFFAFLNIYYHTICSNLTIFLPQILPHLLPQTTATNHYHNWRVNIYYHTNFYSNPIRILPMVPRGGTVGQQMDSFSFSFFSSCSSSSFFFFFFFFPPPNWPKRGVKKMAKKGS